MNLQKQTVKQKQVQTRTFNFQHVKGKFCRTFNCVYARSKAVNPDLVCVCVCVCGVDAYATCCLPVLLHPNEALWPQQNNVRSVNKCTNTA